MFTDKTINRDKFPKISWSWSDETITWSSIVSSVSYFSMTRKWQGPVNQIKDVVAVKTHCNVPLPVHDGHEKAGVAHTSMSYIDIIVQLGDSSRYMSNHYNMRLITFWGTQVPHHIRRKKKTNGFFIGSPLLWYRVSMLSKTRSDHMSTVAMIFGSKCSKWMKLCEIAWIFFVGVSIFTKFFDVYGKLSLFPLITNRTAP